MIRIGVIGYGYWGPNMVRNFIEAPERKNLPPGHRHQRALQPGECLPGAGGFPLRGYGICQERRNQRTACHARRSRAAAGDLSESRLEIHASQWPSAGAVRKEVAG